MLKFSRAQRVRRTGVCWKLLRRISMCSLFCAVQYLSLPAQAAGESAWKTYYAEGEAALASEKPAEAEKSFRQALSAAESTPASSEDTEQCLAKLANTLSLRNKTGEAHALYERLLGLLVKKYGSNSAKIAPVLISLGSIQESLGDHTTAISYYQRALKINQKNYGPYSPAFAENLRSLGRANHKAGNKREAVKQYKQSISILMKDPSLRAGSELQSAMGEYTDLLKTDDDSDKSLIKDFDKDILGKPLNPASAVPINATPVNSTAPVSAPANSAPTNSEPAKKGSSENSGNFQTAGGDVQGGSASNTQPISVEQQSGSEDSGESAWQKQTMLQRTSRGLAQSNEAPQVKMRSFRDPWSAQTLAPAFKIVNDSIVNQTRYDKGEDYYQRMIAVDIDALGPNHPSVANDLNGLAQLYIHQKHYAQAEPLLIRAYEIYKQVYGLDNLLTINAAVSYAMVESRLNKAAEAEALYRVILAHSQSLGPKSIETARVLNNLAHLYFSQGKMQDALTYYKLALASTERAVDPSSPLLAACLQDYAKVLRALNQTGEAATLEERANRILIGSSATAVTAQ